MIRATLRYLYSGNIDLEGGQEQKKGDGKNNQSGDGNSDNEAKEFVCYWYVEG